MTTIPFTEVREMVCAPNDPSDPVDLDDRFVASAAFAANHEGGHHDHHYHYQSDHGFVLCRLFGLTDNVADLPRLGLYVIPGNRHFAFSIR